MGLITQLCTANTELSESYWSNKPAGLSSSLMLDHDGASTVRSGGLHRSLSALDRERGLDGSRGFVQRIKHIVSESSVMRCGYWNLLAAVSLRNACVLASLPHRLPSSRHSLLLCVMCVCSCASQCAKLLGLPLEVTAVQDSERSGTTVFQTVVGGNATTVFRQQAIPTSVMTGATFAALDRAPRLSHESMSVASGFMFLKDVCARADPLSSSQSTQTSFLAPAPTHSLLALTDEECYEAIVSRKVLV